LTTLLTAFVINPVTARVVPPKFRVPVLVKLFVPASVVDTFIVPLFVVAALTVRVGVVIVPAFVLATPMVRELVALIVPVTVLVSAVVPTVIVPEEIAPLLVRPAVVDRIGVMIVPLALFVVAALTVRIVVTFSIPPVMVVIPPSTSVGMVIRFVGVMIFAAPLKVCAPVLAV
jgi:hypothetical protein